MALNRFGCWAQVVSTLTNVFLSKVPCFRVYVKSYKYCLNTIVFLFINMSQTLHHNVGHEKSSYYILYSRRGEGSCKNVAERAAWTRKWYKKIKKQIKHIIYSLFLFIISVIMFASAGSAGVSNELRGIYRAYNGRDVRMARG